MVKGSQLKVRVRVSLMVKVMARPRGKVKPMPLSKRVLVRNLGSTKGAVGSGLIPLLKKRLLFSLV